MAGTSPATAIPIRRDFAAASTAAAEKSSILGVVVLVVFLLAGEDLLGDQAGALADRFLDLSGDFRVAFEEGFRVLAALPDALAVIGEPGAGLLDHAGLDAEVDELAHLGNALA